MLGYRRNLIAAKYAAPNGEEDHVHLLVQYPPKVALSHLVNSLKGVSSRQLRQELVGRIIRVARINPAAMHSRLWSPSYLAGTCGGEPLSTVKNYITNQKRPDWARFPPCAQGRGFHPRSPMNAGGSKEGASKVLQVTMALALGSLAAAAIAGCGGATPKAGSVTAGAATSVADTNPLTGLEGSPKGPVVAVKVDDTAAGLPSLGVDKADVIYIEEVEGGLSRMVAIFASAKPDVRAVRSIRTSDPELLGQYGKIIVVASGGAGSAMKTLDASALHSVINDRGQVGFRRDHTRPAPYNVISDLAKVSASIKAEGVRDVGFRWAARDPRLAQAKPVATVRTQVGQTPVVFVWDANLARYVRTINGLRVLTGSGTPVAKPNVLVQYCQIVADPTDHDVNKNPSMFTTTVGSGRVVLFRNGKRITGGWSRPTLGAPTTFTDAAGKPLLFAPGGTFMALVRPGAPA